MENYTPYENVRFLAGTVSPANLALYPEVLKEGSFTVQYNMPHPNKPSYTEITCQLETDDPRVNLLFLINLWEDPKLTEILHVIETSNGRYQERRQKRTHTPESKDGAAILQAFAHRLWRGIVKLEECRE